MKSEKFGSISTDRIKKATAEVKAIIPKGHMTAADVDAIVGALLSKL